MYIRTIGEESAELNIERFQDFTWGEEFKVSRVAYEDGIQDFKFGNKTNNTVWINPDNMYIVDEEQVENIYNSIKDFECYSFSGSTIIDPAYDVGDIVVIDGKKVIFQGDMEYVGKFKASISSKIQPKSKEETTVRNPSQKTVNRRVQSQIDQVEGKITQLVEETSEYDKKITKVEQDVEKIEQDVESIADFTREKTQMENLYLDDIAEGEGYLLDFIIYGNTEYFTKKEITICASRNRRGFGEAIYLLAEDGEELLTEDGQNIIIGQGSYYIKNKKIVLDDVLRNLNVDGEDYYDTLEILQNGTIQITRRIGVDSSGELYLLENEEKTILEEELILPSIKEGVYYFIEECPNLSYYTRYIVENDYSNTFLTKLELGTKLIQNAEYLRVAWNQISQYLQMEGIDGKATLNIYDKDNNILMSLNQDGLNFYDEYKKNLGSIGVIREDERDILAFSMPVDWKNIDNSRSMAWGIYAPDGKFLPVFYLAGYYGDEESEYGGEIVVEGNLATESLELTKGSMSAHGGLNIIDAEGNSILTIIDNFLMIGNFITSYLNGKGTYTTQITGVLSSTEGMYVNIDDTTGYYGFPMIGLDTSNKYFCHSLASNEIGFYLNNTFCGSISDKRLKKNIKKIDDKLLSAINELEIKQFKAKNRNGQIGFGIIAQELIEVFKQYDIDPNNYEILQEIDYDLTDSTKYYRIEYTQYLVLKQLATDNMIKKQQEEIKQLKEKDKQKDEVIQDLLKRIEKLEEEKNGN